jgi:hypothetical protein
MKGSAPRGSKGKLLLVSRWQLIPSEAIKPEDTLSLQEVLVWPMVLYRLVFSPSLHLLLEFKLLNRIAGVLDLS